MKDKTISKEQIEMLFEATLSEFRLSRHFAGKFPEAERNAFVSQFAGYRLAIDILGLSDDYLAYAVSKKEQE